MSTQTVNLLFTRGDDESLVFTFDQDVADFSAAQLTIREGWATTEADNTEALFTVALTPDADPRVATATVPKSVTLALQYARYVYDVEVVAAGKNHTPVSGEIRMKPDVGRS